MYLDSNNQLVHADTDVVYIIFWQLNNRYEKYENWLLSGGINADETCRLEVARFYCMEIFPPCESPTNYAVYPCREECDFLYGVCNEYTPFDCPLDGPSSTTTIPTTGKQINSNNGFQSCFSPDRSIIPYPFILYLHLPSFIHLVVLMLLFRVVRGIHILPSVLTYGVTCVLFIV